MSRLGLIVVAVAATLVCMPEAEASTPSPGRSKVMIGKYLVAQPNATSPASILRGLPSDVIEEYEATTLASVDKSVIGLLRTRAEAERVSVDILDEFDHVIINGRRIDSRVGLPSSLPELVRDPPYPQSESGSFILQFHGPIKGSWLNALRELGITTVQYLPFNAYLVAATPKSIESVSRWPVVQLVEQLHAALKPAVKAAKDEAILELWIQLAETKTTVDTVGVLEKLAVDGFSASPWSVSETRVAGRFRAEDLATILRQPLVIAMVRRPRIAMSGEREATILTNQPPGTGAGKYKKWLADTCSVCGNLASEDYYVGVADLGIDGGFHAQGPAIANETGSSDLHRPELPKSRLAKGTQFQSATEPFNPGNNLWGDSTNSLHDVHGHGTMVAGIIAGDPTGTPAGEQDGDGFYLGMGVAPSAGLVISKIKVATIADRTDPVTEVVSDARLHLTKPAYVQNHSYNQYTPYGRDCDEYFDGYYSVLSRDFDLAVLDANSETTAREQTLLTVASGNVSGQGFSMDSSCWLPRHFLTLPPATAKNVLAVGMAENVRPSSSLWNCFGALAEAMNNVSGNSKVGTVVAGWFKPDLMAAASDITSVKTHDLSPLVSSDFCQNGTTQPTLPTGYFSSTGTSFAAPAAAGAAILASRYYASWRNPDGGPSSASPALLKAMLVAGATTMRDGLNRNRAAAWIPSNPPGIVRRYVQGERVTPRSPNGHVYEAQNTGDSGSVEPNWPVSGPVIETGGSTPRITWTQVGSEPQVVGLPSAQQGFGRINLSDVLSSFPSRDLLPSEGPLAAGQTPWTKAYKVHDGGKEVRVALVWTDRPAFIDTNNGENHISVGPLVNDLDLTVEFGSPCSRYVGNHMTFDTSVLDTSCVGGTFDRLNNIEVVRFNGSGDMSFTVKVSAFRSFSGESQDFALVVYNAYDPTSATPPGVPGNLAATAGTTTRIDLTWNAATAATSYDVQRSSGVNDPFVNVGTNVSSPFPDSTVIAGRSYLYRVLARNSGPTVGVSSTDLATTILFDDDPLIVNTTKVRLPHVNQLRDAVAAGRMAAALPPYIWTDGQILSGVTTIRAVHLTELRAALDAARLALGLTGVTYSESLIPPATLIRAIHVNELRLGVQ